MKGMPSTPETLKKTVLKRALAAAGAPRRARRREGVERAPKDKVVGLWQH
jgi:hypothetical protein